MDWAYLLDPANGGPGETPGYQQLLVDMRANPKQPKTKQPKPKRPSTSHKHKKRAASQQPRVPEPEQGISNP